MNIKKSNHLGNGMKMLNRTRVRISLNKTATKIIFNSIEKKKKKILRQGKNNEY